MKSKTLANTSQVAILSNFTYSILFLLADWKKCLDIAKNIPYSPAEKREEVKSDTLFDKLLHRYDVTETLMEENR